MHRVYPLGVQGAQFTLAPPPEPLIWVVRFVLFKLMVMSGTVKLQAQCPTWTDLTALNYHFATQCLPTPIAWCALTHHPLSASPSCERGHSTHLDQDAFPYTRSTQFHANCKHANSSADDEQVPLDRTGVASPPYVTHRLVWAIRIIRRWAHHLPPVLLQWGVAFTLWAEGPAAWLLLRYVLGGAKSLLGDAKRSLGGAKSSLGQPPARAAAGGRGRAAERGSEGGLPVNGVRVACQ